jgi:hypothetical protein
MRRTLYIAVSTFYSLVTAVDGSFSGEQAKQWRPICVSHENHNNAALGLTLPTRRDGYKEVL